MEHIFNNVKNPRAKFFLPLQAIEEYLAKPESERRVTLVREDKSECYVGTVGGINGEDSQNPKFTINIDESAPGGAELLKALKEGKSFACSIGGDRLLDFPDIVTHQKIFDVSLHQAKDSAEDGYVPREITRYEYDMVCESSQHFTETYEQYCDRIHNKEHAEYLHNKYRPVENALQSAVVPDNDGDLHIIYYMAKVHRLGNGKCTKMYVPTKFDESSIAEVGEENFHKFVEKYDGKTEHDL